MKVRVHKKTLEAIDIQTFELVAIDGSELPPFTAGAHVEVQIADQLSRRYSLCNSPIEAKCYVLGVLRDPATRGGSAAMHDRVLEGDTLEISAPKNNFALVSGAHKSLLFAGGIGVTPLLSMAEQLASQGGPFEMHYCARSRDRAAFVSRIAKSPFAAHVHFHYDDQDHAQRLDLSAELGTVHEATHIYVCGPAGFIDWVLSGARQKGWPDVQLHVEYFSAALLDASNDEPFEVKIASTGDIYYIPVGKTILDVLAADGYDIATSCGEGVCGTCLTGVLKGEPDHRDFYLSADSQAQNNMMLPCCSRAKSKLLVLDL
jgi:vanillate O-demethylase ferredoxin subunit